MNVGDETPHDRAHEAGASPIVSAERGDAYDDSHFFGGANGDSESGVTTSASETSPQTLAAQAVPVAARAVVEPAVTRMQATVTLIVLNVAVFLFVNVITQSPRREDLIDAGAMWGPAFVHGEYWRLVTGAFLHANFLHITTNMLALFQVGSLIETMLGWRRMLAAYAFAMFTSGIAILLFTFDAPSIGASGAIFGLFGTLVALGLRLGRSGRMLVRQVLPIIAINLAIGFVVPGISNAAHIGGLIGGFAAGFALLAMGRLRAVPQPIGAQRSQP